MKRYRLYIWTTCLLAVILLMTACSADGLTATEPQPAQESVRTARYINLRIVNGSSQPTRASEQQENAVYDGILAIFEGADERSATLKSAVVIDQLINNPGTGTSISITQRLAATHHPTPITQHLYILALLNTTATGLTVSNNVLYLNGLSLAGKTIGEVQSQEINGVGSPDEHVGLFMSNAPQSTYIMPEATALFDTEEEARQTGAATVTLQVERAAAKVSVTNAATTLPSILLNGVATSHPKVHQMTWTVNKYQTQSYVVRKGYTAAANWATSVSHTPTAYSSQFFDQGQSDFVDYSVLSSQFSYSGDEVYIAENTTTTADQQTEVIVEVQLKDASSMLLGDCYTFHPYGGEQTTLFTSTTALISYLKSGLTNEQKHTYNLSARSADEVYKYPEVYIHADGSVTLTLSNESFNATEKTGLASLATALSGWLTGYRQGRMYYTYKIKHDDTPTYGVVRNNAYQLTFGSPTSIGRATP